MGYEALVGHLMQAAQERRDAILAGAREEAGRMEAEARRTADAAESASRELAVREAESARRARMVRARREARAEGVRARAALAEAILVRIRECLERLVAEPRYAAVAERLVREILPEIPPGELVLRADPQAMKCLSVLASDPRCVPEPLPDGEIGGVEVSDAEGRFRIRNTLRARFEKAKPLLMAEIGQRLPAPDE